MSRRASCASAWNTASSCPDRSTIWLIIGASERTVNQSVIYWLLHGPLSHAENHELSTGAADVLHVELSLAIRPRVRGEDCLSASESRLEMKPCVGRISAAERFRTISVARVVRPS